MHISNFYVGPDHVCNKRCILFLSFVMLHPVYGIYIFFSDSSNFCEWLCSKKIGKRGLEEKNSNKKLLKKAGDNEVVRNIIYVYRESCKGRDDTSTSRQSDFFLFSLYTSTDTVYCVSRKLVIILFYFLAKHMVCFSLQQYSVTYIYAFFVFTRCSSSGCNTGYMFTLLAFRLLALQQHCIRYSCNLCRCNMLLSFSCGPPHNARLWDTKYEANLSYARMQERITLIEIVFLPVTIHEYVYISAPFFFCFISINEWTPTLIIKNFVLYYYSLIKLFILYVSVFQFFSSGFPFYDRNHDFHILFNIRFLFVNTGLFCSVYSFGDYCLLFQFWCEKDK